MTLRAAVIGGSLGGLSAAVILRDRGFDVDVYERSDSKLKSRGAGIVLHEATTRYLIEKGLVALDDISAYSQRTRYIDTRGVTVHDFAITYRFSSWNSLYRALLSCFDLDRYHLGRNYVSHSDRVEKVCASFERAPDVDCDLLVCADGIASTARSILLPQVVPEYAGYVGWRGTVAEEELTPETFAALFETIIYCVLPDGHMLAYPIPNLDGALSRGKRLINFIWYRNVGVGEDLDALMTDRTNSLRSISVPPGSVRDAFVQELRSAAEEQLPPIFRELVTKVREPFIQQVLDVEVPRMAFGRTCLIGDAAFTARPHPAAGTAKAADDAWSLGQFAGSAKTDLAGSLLAWEKQRLQVGSELVARGKDMGRRSQFLNRFVPGDPSLAFGLYQPGDSRLPAGNPKLA